MSPGRVSGGGRQKPAPDPGVKLMALGQGSPQQRILVLEADDSNRDFAEKTLTAEGFKVDAVPNVDAALRKAKSNRYAAVLVDTSESVSSRANKLTDYLFSLGEDRPPMILTTSEDHFMGNKRYHQSVGYADVLKKPFDKEKLVASVRKNMRYTH